MTGPDVLGRPDRAPRRGRRTGLVLVVVLAAGGYAGDRWQEHRESGALLACVTSAQGELSYALKRIAATEQYVSPQLTSSTAPVAVRQSLASLVERVAREAVPVVRAARARCDGRTVLWWHGSQAQARARYGDYLDAQLAQLTAVGADLRAIAGGTAVSDRLRLAARTAVLPAVPSGSTTEVAALLSP